MTSLVKTGTLPVPAGEPSSSPPPGPVHDPIESPHADVTFLGRVVGAHIRSSL